MARQHVVSGCGCPWFAVPNYASMECHSQLVVVGRVLSGSCRRVLIKLGIVAVVTIAAFLLWGGGAAFFLALFAASICGLVDGRISVVLGLLSLACCPLLLVINREAWLQQSSLVNYYVASLGVYSLSGAADEVAVWAYYFLCIGVVTQIVRYYGREKAIVSKVGIGRWRR